MFANGKMKAVTFSYDDGVTQDKRLVELFNYYGLKCTFNLNTGIQSPESCWDNEGLKISRMKQDGLAEMYKGHEIASHALTHQALTGLSQAEFKREMQTDIDNIAKLYGEAPVGMAYPYGAFDDEAVKGLEQLGLKYARTVNSTHSFDMQSDLLRFNPTCHHNDEMLIELGRQFISLQTDTPKLFYIWGHSYEFDVMNNWQVIEDFCRLISGKDDIYYGTNKNVLITTED